MNEITLFTNISFVCIRNLRLDAHALASGTSMTDDRDGAIGRTA